MKREFMVPPLQEYYAEIFSREGEAKTLLNPITALEVGIVAGILKKGRATGPNELAGK